jgi:hypothetical protein
MGDCGWNEEGKMDGWKAIRRLSLQPNSIYSIR